MQGKVFSLGKWSFRCLWSVQPELSKKQLGIGALAQEPYPGEKCDIWISFV